MTFFEIIRNLYQKKKKVPEIDDGMLIVLNKWLSFDKDNTHILSKLVPYLFYIEPEHYYYLLYLSIPYKQKVPYLKKVDNKKEEDSELVKKIQYILGWSTNELNKNRSILEQTVLKEKSYWKKELGL